VLDDFKEECAGKNMRNIAIPKDRFGFLLSGTLEKANKNNIIAGFAACGIIPLDVNRLLSRLPREKSATEVQGEFSQQLAEELKRNRYGEAPKRTRAKKANRLPAGMAYTVSAKGDSQQEEASASAVQSGEGTSSGITSQSSSRGRGTWRPAYHGTELNIKIAYHKSFRSAFPKFHTQNTIPYPTY
jgi:hypothetical protein